MKRKNKWLAILLSVALIVSSMTAFAEEVTENTTVNLTYDLLSFA